MKEEDEGENFNREKMMKDISSKSKDMWSTLKTRWKMILILAAIFITGLVIGLLLKTGGVEGPVEESVLTAEAEGKILFWTCSMHPQIKKAGPGRCPICGMDLVPMREEAGGGERASLKLGERARHLASIETIPVTYRKLTKSIYTVGKIDYDETRVAHVTAWVDGRVDKLYVNFTGTMVKQGEHLVYMYSPDLLSTQEEYLLAYRGVEQLKKSPVPEIVTSSKTLLENTRQRLRLWGITEEQIDELKRTQTPQVHMTIYAPMGGTVINKKAFEGMYFKTGDRLFTIADLSRVWLYLDIYEYDIPWIRYGQDIEVVTESYPGEVFHGTVVFVDPFLNETTRTVKVRVNMDNRDGKLKPGMYANASFKIKLGSEGVIFDPKIMGKYMCPMHPDVLSDKQDNCPECGMKLEPVGGRMGVFVPGLIQPQYECPMQCQGSVSDGSAGSCSMCGMELTKNEAEGVQGEKPVYVCSEHVDDQPGSSGECPVCQRSLKIKIKGDMGVLAVPHSAVLFTGKRNIVYVEKEEGNYVPREVIVGSKSDEYYPVVSGLSDGEKVVTSGTFLVDSQMQLLGKPSLLFPEGSALEKPIIKKDERHEHEHKHPLTGAIEEPELKLAMGHVLNNYYAVATRLATDSIGDINENLDLIISNSRKVRDMDLDISEGLLKRLSEIAGKIEDSANEMKGIELEKARERFKDLSQAMIMLLKEFQGKIAGAEKAYVYYCPMVDASWLQKEKGTLNPYYGSKMLKCGSVKEELP